MSHRKDLFRFTAQLGVAAVLFTISPAAAALGTGAVSVAALLGLKLDRRDADLKNLIARTQAAAEAALAGSSDFSEADFARASTLLEGCTVEIDPAAYVQSAREGQPEMLLADRIIDGLDSQPGDEAPIRILRLTLPVTFRTAGEHAKADQRITREFLTQILRDAGLVPAIKGDTEELLRRVAFLTQKVTDLESAREARAAGVSEAALFRLVRPIAEHITDRDEALLALQEAVQIAKRVQQEGRHGSNLGDFVDAVLGRVTALSARGEYETAISELDEALAREEAESNARTHRLLRSAIDQHLLAFDAEGAAAKIARRVDLDTPDPTARVEALRSEFIQWYERGRDKGLRLDLEVSIALARLALARAAGPDQRGTALNDLGAALRTLGQRETGTARLEEAVDAYRAALQERTRDRVPLDWATTQNNLGNALQTLGERETGTARLKEAVAIYRAALQERTRDRVPFLWAQTRENMALAHRAIFERTGDPADLDAARRAVAQALEIYEEAGAGFYIEKATRLREDLDQLAP